MTRYLRCWRRVKRRRGREEGRRREDEKNKKRKAKKKNIPNSSRRKRRFTDKEHLAPQIIAFHDRRLETTDTHPYNVHVVIHVVVPAVMFPAEDFGNVK